MFNEWEIPLNIWTHYLPPTSRPILRRSHHRSRHGNAPAPPMIIVFILVTSPVRARRATPRLRPFHPFQLASEPSKSQLPALCFTQNPGPTFPPNIFTLRSQSHRQDDPAECNGVGEEWPCAILRNPKGHEMACSRRNLTETRKQPTGYNL